VKRLIDLTVEDLVASLVWRYEGGSGAEAMVSPTDRDTLSQSDDEIFLAGTEFELFDGTRHGGFCFPAESGGVDYLQPVILTPMGPVSFWFDEAPPAQALSEQWRALAKEHAAIFPIAFRCLVAVDERMVTGRIERVEFPREAAAAPNTKSDPPASPRRGGIGKQQTRTVRRRKAEMTVEFTQGALQGAGVTGDISRRGMFVRSNLAPGTGPVVRLTVNLPGGRKLAMTGRVVRNVESAPATRTAPGFGLRLVDDWPEYDEIFGRRDIPHKK
jgi:PilZ domain